MFDIELAIDHLLQQNVGVRPTVIFTEPTDPRIIEAVCHLVRFIRPVLLASEATVRSIAANELRHVDANSLEFAFSESSFMLPAEREDLIEEFAGEYVAFYEEKGRKIAMDTARGRVSHPGLFGIMAVRLHHADMVVGGIAHEPRLFYRPMCEMLSPSGFCAEAGIFNFSGQTEVDNHPHNIVVLGDVGVNSTFTPDVLARVAVGTSMIARDILPEDLLPKVRGVIVSYSNHGADDGPSPALVDKAMQLVPAFLENRCHKDPRYKSVEICGGVKASVALSARSAMCYDQGGADWAAPSAIVCPNLEMGNMLYHLYAANFPDAKNFTIMFGLRSRGVSLAPDFTPESICLGVKATVHRLLCAPNRKLCDSSTFFASPLILVINPGSTSTKIALFKGEKEIFLRELDHTEELKQYEGKTFIDQFGFRKQHILRALAENGYSVDDLDAVAARGGLLMPMPHGTYYVGQAMLDELKVGKWGKHACNLGALIAHSMLEGTGKIAYIVDPGVVDELADRVRITGIKEVRRRVVSHTLNQLAIARRYAAEHETFYERLNLVIAHMGGGVSVGAHKRGRYIDTNNALDGEGPFSAERSGSLPVSAVIDMCFSGKYTLEQMRALNKGKGGLISLLGTPDLRVVEKMIDDGDDFAALVLDALAYRVAKEICSLWPAFDGQQVDQILLTGGMARCKTLVEKIKTYVSNTGVGVSVYPGENEMIALAKGVLRVLLGKEQPLTYPPVQKKW